MMEYLTFISHKDTWQLYKGVGTETRGASHVKQDAPYPVQDMSAAAQSPWLWLCGKAAGGQSTIQRMTLPDLQGETVDWSGKRLGAIASSPSGERAVVIELPEVSSQTPRVILWSDQKWQPLDLDTIPDISSKVAWLDERRIVFESSRRKLVVANVSSGELRVGPNGRYPASATKLGEWYACVGSQVGVFPVREPFREDPKDLEGFDFGDITSLRITHDGEVCTWTEPKFLYKSKAYIQRRGEKKMRIRLLDDGLGAVIGPYSV